jgi:hypothetical protein
MVNIGLSGVGQTRATFSLLNLSGAERIGRLLTVSFFAEDDFLELFPINTSW